MAYWDKAIFVQHGPRTIERRLFKDGQITRIYYFRPEPYFTAQGEYVDPPFATGLYTAQQHAESFGNAAKECYAIKE